MMLNLRKYSKYLRTTGYFMKMKLKADLLDKHNFDKTKN